MEEKFIRIFVEGTGLPALAKEGLLAFFEGCGVTSWFAALERGRSKRLHWQAYVRGPKGLEDSMRKWLKDNEYRGNKCYSIKDRDERGIVGLLSYLMKQGQWSHSGMEAEIIDEASKMNAAYREVAKMKKESTYSLLKSWLETRYTRSEEGPGFWYSVKTEVDYFSKKEKQVQVLITLRQVIDDVVDWFTERPGLASAPMIEGYATTMGLRFVNGFRHHLKKKIYEKISGQDY